MGYWQGKKVLFIGDSITARRVYPEIVKEILGIETFYHCRGGRGILAMVDGDRGLNGDYSDFSPTADLLLPLTAEEVKDMDMVVLYGGYNNVGREGGQAGDLYALDGRLDIGIKTPHFLICAKFAQFCRLLILHIKIFSIY